MPPPTCKVCAERFNNERNRPLLMPCSRSVCRACVLRWLIHPSQQCYACLGYHDSVRVDNLQVNIDLLEESLPPPPDSHTRTRGEQSSGVIQIVLQNATGEKCRIHVPATATVKTLKNLIRDQYGFDIRATRLLFAGKVLQNNITLAFYGVKEGSILQMVTSFIGGRLSQTRL